MSAEAAQRFGPGGRFELQPLRRRLLVDGEPAGLGARAFDVLLALAARPGELVTKNQLLDAVWAGVVVEENNLATQISALRKVLGGDVIATIPGRGYRFTATLQHPDETAAAAPPSGERTARGAPARTPLVTNLPERLPPLLGRADDLAALGALVDTHALVTVVGAGGMGKTRLAQTFLHSRRGAYRHGVCWAELATVNDPASLPSAIAAALAVDPGKGDPLRGLCGAVAGLEMLLVLDNVEQVLEGAARVVQALLDAAPGVRLLVTSQAPLKLAAERIHRLDALALPQGPLPAAKALDFGAVALFAERAQAADSRFMLTDANAPGVIELCRRLDGLPLAIELAAARAPMLGVQLLAQSMHERLKLLTSSGNRIAPARQQTLRAALEWSHGFLDEHERAVFRRLAVFAGSASLAQIQQVVSDPQGELDEWTVLDALTLLVDRSLVAVDAGHEAEMPRYRLLESARVFALERLEQAGELALLRRRHAQVFADWGDTAWDVSFSATMDLDAWRIAMAPDVDNARDAFAWSRAEGDATTALRVGVGMLRAMSMSMIADRAVIADACEALIEQASGIDLQVRAWLCIGNQHLDYETARASTAFMRGLDLIGASTEAPRNAWMHYVLTMERVRALWFANAASSTRALFEEAMAYEDPTWPAGVLLYGARAEEQVARAEGDVDGAFRALRRQIALANACGRNTLLIVTNQVDLELAVGDAAAAARTGAALLEALAGRRDERSLAYARVNLAAAWLALDDGPAARALLQAGWEKAAVFRLQPYYADYLALLAALEGRPRSAARLVGYSDAANAPTGPRQTNEAAARERADALARTSLGDTEFERLHSEGSTLREAEVAALAFAGTDVP